MLTSLISHDVMQLTINIGFILFSGSFFLLLIFLFIHNMKERGVRRLIINRFCEIRDCLSHASTYIEDPITRNFIHLISKHMRDNGEIPDEVNLAKIHGLSKGVEKCKK